MVHPLSVLAQSLQTTSQVLSSKGLIEQSMLQESAIQLLGHFILEDVVLQEIASGRSKEVAQDVGRMGLDDGQCARVLKEVANAAWVSGHGTELVLLTRVDDADDWAALPIQLQNYVAEEQMPCHIMLATQQMELDGDGRYRHYVLPVFAVLSSDGFGGLSSFYAFVQREHRDQVIKNADEMKNGAAATLEPYLRLVAQYVVGNIERV